jgi:hypothetical protein
MGRQSPSLCSPNIGDHLAHTHRALTLTDRCIIGRGLLRGLFLIGQFTQYTISHSKRCTRLFFICVKRRETMNSASETAGWHDRQRQTLTSHTPLNPSIPTDYNCPKDACSTPPPPPPIPIREGFSTNSHTWLITMGATTILFIALTLLTKRN